MQGKRRWKRPSAPFPRFVNHHPADISSGIRTALYPPSRPLASAVDIDIQGVSDTYGQCLGQFFCLPSALNTALAQLIKDCSMYPVEFFRMCQRYADRTFFLSVFFYQGLSFCPPFHCSFSFSAIVSTSFLRLVRSSKNLSGDFTRIHC